MLIAAIDPGLFVAFVAAVLGAGGIGSIVAFRKAGKEADEIAARTLIAVNDELRKELRRRDDELSALRGRVSEAESQLEAKEREVAELRRRLGDLEDEVHRARGT